MGLPEPLEIAHGDIKGGYGRPRTGYFNSLLVVSRFDEAL
jgi:hypothetical protein